MSRRVRKRTFSSCRQIPLVAFSISKFLFIPAILTPVMFEGGMGQDISLHFSDSFPAKIDHVPQFWPMRHSRSRLTISREFCFANSNANSFSFLFLNSSSCMRHIYKFPIHGIHKCSWIKHNYQIK